MRHSFLKKLWWAVYARYPNIVPYKGKSTFAKFDEWTSKENEGTSLPTDEGLNVICIWASELFGPAEINSLYSGLERLGWTKGGLSRTRCDEWVRQQRRSGSEAWLNIGLVHRSDYAGFNADKLVAELPDGVDYAIAYVHQICPSLTCLQLAFVLELDKQGVFAQELMVPRAKDTEPVRETVGAYRILGPFHIKEKAVDARRQELRQMATTWIRKYFPGLFVGTFVTHPPTAELIATRKVPVLGHIQDEPHPNWRNTVSGEGYRTLWKFQNHDTLLIATPDQDEDGSSHTHICICTERVPEDALKHYGAKDHTALVAYVHGLADGMLARFAVRSLLILFRASLMEMRDQLRLVALRKLRTKKLLEYVQRFFSQTVQVPSIAQEIESSSTPVGRYRRYCEGFLEAAPFGGHPAGILGERLADNVNYLAKQLLMDDKSTRDALKQVFEVVAARENIRTQRRMELVAVIAVVLAALSLWIGLPSCEQWPDLLHRYAEHVCKLKGYSDR